MGQQEFERMMDEAERATQPGDSFVREEPYKMVPTLNEKKVTHLDWHLLLVYSARTETWELAKYSLDEREIDLVQETLDYVGDLLGEKPEVDISTHKIKVTIPKEINL